MTVTKSSHFRPVFRLPFRRVSRVSRRIRSPEFGQRTRRRRRTRCNTGSASSFSPTSSFSSTSSCPEPAAPSRRDLKMTGGKTFKYSQCVVPRLQLLTRTFIVRKTKNLSHREVSWIKIRIHSYFERICSLMSLKRATHFHRWLDLNQTIYKLGLVTWLC